MINLLLVLLAVTLGLLLKVSPIVFLLVVTVIAGIIILRVNYEVAIYVMAFYAIIDYSLRRIVPSLAGAWDDLALLGLLALIFYKWILYRKEPDYKWSPIDIPLLLYVLTNFVCIFVQPYNMHIVLEGFRVNVEFLFFFFAFFHLIKSDMTIKYIYIALLSVVFIISLHGVYQYIIGVPMPPGWVDSVETGIKTRAYSIIGSPNILGSLIALVSPLVIGLFIVEKKYFIKLIYLGMYATMLLCLVVTYSRGAWFVFLGGMFVYILLKDIRFIVPAIIGVILVLVFIPSIGDRLAYMFSLDYIQSSLKGGRLVRWGDGIEVVKQYPFFGLGLGQIGGAVATNNEVDGYYYMDNYYLKLAAEIGLIGFFMFFNLMYRVVKWCFLGVLKVENKFKKELMIAGFVGIISIVFNNFVENIFEVPLMVITFWLIIACVMNLWYYDEKSYKK